MVSLGMLGRVALTRATRRNIPEDTILHKQAGLAMSLRELVDGLRSYSTFKSPFIPGWSPENVTKLVPKTEGLQRCPKSQNGNFLGNGFCSSDKISVVHGGHLPM
jgi:hypothetical protein